jgi:hypothetical protein
VLTPRREGLGFPRQRVIGRDESLKVVPTGDDRPANWHCSVGP